MNPKLRIHMLHVRFHRIARHHKLLLDVLSVAAASQHDKYLALAGRKAAFIANGGAPFFELFLGGLRLRLLHQRHHPFYGSREAEILQPYQGIADEKRTKAPATRIAACSLSAKAFVDHTPNAAPTIVPIPDTPRPHATTAIEP